MRELLNPLPISTRRFVPLALLLLGLSGCGGGGSASVTAVPDTYVINSGGNITVNAPGVLLNDSGSGLTAQLVSGPAGLTLNSNGSFSYIGGIATSFTYRAVNGTGSATATVTININQPPVAANTCLSTPVNTSLNGTLTATDEPGSQPVMFQQIPDATVGPNKGNVVVNPNGTFTYAPNNTTVRGMDKFRFRATDQLGLTSDAIATVFIDGSIRIMPLGDSITAGLLSGQPSSVWVGYRRKLYNDLSALNPTRFGINFVGSVTNQGESASPPLADRDHDGHDGWCDDTNPACGTGSTISDNLISGLNFLNNNPPDIILLHIGTNSFNINNSGVNSILNNINTWAQSNYPVTVFVARIIPSVDGSLDVNTFNNNVTAIATDRAAVKVYVVNQQSTLQTSLNIADTALMSDNLHPNQTGYDKIADKWKADLINSGVLPNCP